MKKDCGWSDVCACNGKCSYMPNTDDRRKVKRRTQGERKESIRRIALTLVGELEMQARTHCAANRRMKVEPINVEKTIEWKAAQFIKGMYSGAG